MPKDIDFEANPQFAEKFVMHRLAQIVRGRACRHYDTNLGEKEEDQNPESMPFKKENDSWQLDHGNNWFGRRVEFGKKAKYNLSHRYDAPIEGLKEFLEYLFR